MSHKASREGNAGEQQGTEKMPPLPDQSPQVGVTPIQNGVKQIDPHKDRSKTYGNTQSASSDSGNKGRKKILKGVGIALGSLLGLVLIAYIAGSIFFTGRFFPQTTIGDFDVSMMTTSEAQDVLAKGIENYELAVEGQGLSFVLSANEAGVTLDTDAIVSDAMNENQSWMWPFELQSDHNRSDVLVASYGEDGMGEAVQAIVDEFNNEAKQPTNATIAYDTNESAYIITPEALGTALDADAIKSQISEAISAMAPSLKLTESVLRQPSVLASNSDLITARDNANEMVKADLTFVQAGTTVKELNADQLSEWITLGDDLSATLNESSLSDWVDDLVNASSTIGTERTFTRADGKQITVTGGVYGWTIDRATLMTKVQEGVAAGSTETIEIPTSQTAAVFTGVGTRDWGTRYCDIDLSEQHARLYDESGNIIWESDFVSGAKGTHDTPTGVNMINSNKASPSTLIGYKPNGEKDYETKVSYWMPFVDNSVGLHDATWQSAFGGSRFSSGYGSHGCVNLPLNKAKELYGIIKVGDVVVTHY